MAYPTIYDVTYSYTGFQQAQGNNAFPGTQIDADFAGLEASVSSIALFIRGVLRSDGQLNNGVVTYDSLSANLQTAGLAPAAPWATAVSFLVGASVTQNGALYRALIAHTSGVFATDLAAGKWLLIVQLTGTNGTNGATGPGYGGTSATSLLIANSVTKVFTTQAGLAYQNGSYVRASSAANGANFMEGVATYSGTTMSIAVTNIGGSGTRADWTFAVSGAPGSVGVATIDTKSGAFLTAGGLVTDGNNIAVQQNVPGGRLTLTPSTPAPTTDVTAATAVSFAPLSNGSGGFVPIYNGTIMRLYPFVSSDTDTAGLSVTLGANWLTNTNYDWFVALDSGTVRLGSGPAWTVSTGVGTDARGTGAGTTELELYKGLWVNKNSITLRYANGSTFTAAARQATCVGGFRTVAAGQAEDSKAKRYLFNFYNWEPRICKNVTEVGADDAYTLATPRQARANAANQLDVFIGLAGVCVEPKVTGIASTSAGGSFAAVGIGVNSTTVDSSDERAPTTSLNRGLLAASLRHYPAIGRNTYPWLEFCQGVSGTNTYTYSGAAYQAGISATVWM